MIYHEEKVRVRYGETDKMGYAYYGNYATYLEVARVELIRKLGISYRKIEDEGLMLPVIDFKIQYKKPAFYDDELTIKTWIKKKPKSSIRFEYEIVNENGDLLTTAETTLVFVDSKNMRPTFPHEGFVEAVKGYFEA